MPKRLTPHQQGTKKYLQNRSFELLCAHWFVKAGWQVFTPLFDHEHQTDLLISDGPHYFLIQVKTTESGPDDLEIEKKWAGSNVHYVALLAKNSSWGVVFPAFSGDERKVGETGGLKFELKAASSVKAFHALQ